MGASAGITNRVHIVFVLGSRKKNLSQALEKRNEGFHHIDLRTHLHDLADELSTHSKTTYGGITKDQLLAYLDNDTSGQSLPSKTKILILKDKITTEFLKGSKVFIISNFPSSVDEAVEWEEHFPTPRAILIARNARSSGLPISVTDPSLVPIVEHIQKNGEEAITEFVNGEDIRAAEDELFDILGDLELGS